MELDLYFTDLFCHAPIIIALTIALGLELLHATQHSIVHVPKILSITSLPPGFEPTQEITVSNTAFLLPRKLVRQVTTSSSSLSLDQRIA